MKCFKIRNYNKFKEKLLTLGTNKEIADAINVNLKVVSKWFDSSETRPSSENIRKILERFNLKPEEIGATEFENGVKEKSFAYIFEQLMKEYNLNSSQLEKIFDVSKTAISNWKSGKATPNMDKLKEIARYFNVNILYLLGETDIKNPDNYEISQTLNIGEQLIETLKSENPNATRSFLNISISAEELGEDYYDLKDFLINKELLAVLKEEVDRVILYATNDKYYANFEEVNNERDVYSQTISYSEILSIKDIAHHNICKRFCKVFDKYVDKLLENRGLKYVDNLKRKRNGNNNKGK